MLECAIYGSFFQRYVKSMYHYNMSVPNVYVCTCSFSQAIGLLLILARVLWTKKKRQRQCKYSVRVFNVCWNLLDILV